IENTRHLALGSARAEVNEDASTMEEELERWMLHDCSAYLDARSPNEMKHLLERFRATLGKNVTVTPTVTIRSLDRVWTAFVKRWNLKGCEAYESMLQRREADHARLSVGDLAAQVCLGKQVADAASRAWTTGVRAVASGVSRDRTMKSGVAFWRRCLLLEWRGK
ncbi:hypothetical protein F442_10198, partial [Phytophthora nicotianae P10297]